MSQWVPPQLTMANGRLVFSVAVAFATFGVFAFIPYMCCHAISLPWIVYAEGALHEVIRSCDTGKRNSRAQDFCGIVLAGVLSFVIRFRRAFLLSFFRVVANSRLIVFRSLLPLPGLLEGPRRGEK